MIGVVTVLGLGALGAAGIASAQDAAAEEGLVEARDHICPADHDRHGDDVGTAPLTGDGEGTSVDEGLACPTVVTAGDDADRPRPLEMVEDEGLVT